MYPHKFNVKIRLAESFLKPRAKIYLSYNLLTIAVSLEQLLIRR